jgi:TolA-binding protein
MSDFDVAAAIVAARRQADEAASADDGMATRLRIRESLANQSARRTRRTTIIAGLLATMFGSTAFAYYSDWRPRMLVSVPAEAPPAPTLATDHEPADAPRPVTRTIVRETLPTLPEVVMTLEPPRAPRVAAVEAPVIAAVPEVPAAPDPELAAYRIAHDVHFKGGSPADALLAWDNYLAQYPSGSLAVDAKYSRALVLIKLKRWADARAALQPFANAAAGSYRQAEATKLLAALPKQ